MINIDIQDNHEEATIGAFMICDLCTMVRIISLFFCYILFYAQFAAFIIRSRFQLAESEDLDNDMGELIQFFESKCNRPLLHTVVFY